MLRIKLRLNLTFYLIAIPLIAFSQLEEKWIHNLEEARNYPSDSIFYLSLRDKNLTRFPKEVLHFKNLRKLDISINKIRKIPEEIVSLSNLYELNMSYNPINKLPSEFCKLTNLKIAIFIFSAIKYLPENINELVSLEYLNLNGSNIRELPSSIFELKQLRELYLGNIKDNFSYFSLDRQAELRKQLPDCRIYF